MKPHSEVNRPPTLVATEGKTRRCGASVQGIKPPLGLKAAIEQCALARGILGPGDSPLTNGQPIKAASQWERRLLPCELQRGLH
ncbi:hypothetical protein NDU88_012617 [Pleurodeles waltl]|uniref:Uncharacterized protein n=1 Tax=Pleurodeles waltl TaxID=8319 RepID=A0AAV7R256_PLEWA|nr:hypothetical protein NDU88_012617 [Pleurodeles waltl]